MHYYPHHIGDFMAATSRLSDSQCMAYLRMIWLYYESEKPLPDNTKVVAFKVGSDPETVSLILESFFKLTDGSWRHTRCDGEIAKYRAMQEGGKAGAAKRWGKDSYAPPIATLSGDQSPPNANQEPRTKNHKKNTDNTVSPPDGVSIKVWSDFLKYRKSAKAPVTDTAIDGIRRESAKAGISLEQALITCMERSWRGFKSEWILDKQESNKNAALAGAI